MVLFLGLSTGCEDRPRHVLRRISRVFLAKDPKTDATKGTKATDPTLTDGTFRMAPRTPPYQPKDAPDLEKNRTLYVVNYAHLDTQWRWGFPLTVNQFLPDTVYSNVDYFERYPSHIFNFTGASRYDLIEEYHPELFRTVTHWVKLGRWFPAGNQWEECDVLVPSAESILRQILTGNRYFEEHFGTQSQEFMLPDSFGFPASLPSILSHAGLRGFSTQKLTWHSAKGIPFNVGRWQGFDGRSVIAALNAGNYGAVHRSVLSESPKWVDRLDKNAKVSGLKVDYLYNGTGDVGGAPHEISMVAMEASKRFPGPVNVVVGTSEKMFSDIGDAQAAKFPVHQGDLLLTEHSAGSLTSQAFIKRLNRMNELLANAAERAAVAVDTLGGAPYPTTVLRDAWRSVLRSQFHDIIAGTSIPEAYTYSWNDEFLAMNRFVNTLTDSVAAVGRGLDTSGDGVSLVLYNPLSQARTDIVEIDVPESLRQSKSIGAVDETGRLVMTQRVLDRDGKARLLFRAGVSGDSFTVYSLKEVATPLAVSELTVTDRVLSNHRYRLTLNDNGDISSIYDILTRRELLRAPIQLAFLTEYPQEFPAWNMDWIDRQRPPRGYVTDQPTFEMLEEGPLRASLRVKRQSEGSSFSQSIRLYSGNDAERIEVVSQIDWKSTGCSLKATFPFSVSAPKATYSWGIIPIERENNNEKQYEVPTHSYIDLTDKTGSYGVTLFTGAKYGSDKPSDDTLRLTLLFTPGTSDEYAEQRYQDWGRHDISIALLPHSGKIGHHEAHARADRFEQPILAFEIPKHEGVLGKQFSLFLYDENRVAIRAIKRSEDGRYTVLRLVELSGTKARTQLRSIVPIEEATELNGIEENIASIPVEQGVLRLDFLPHQMRTIGIRLAAMNRLRAPQSESITLKYDLDGVSANGDEMDGDFEGSGATYPKEMLNERLNVGGVEYRLGPFAHGERNVLRAHGQRVLLPSGYERLHILAASTQGQIPALFRIGRRESVLNISPWTGFLGQWDHPVFAGQVPEITFSVENPLVSIASGYLHTERVGWAASHHHQRGLGDVPFRFSYLYSYALDLDPRADSVSLPKDERIAIFAMSVAKDDNAKAIPLSALWPEMARDESFKGRFESP
jgi:alpha-mannosidase